MKTDLEAYDDVDRSEALKLFADELLKDRDRKYPGSHDNGHIGKNEDMEQLIQHLVKTASDSRRGIVTSADRYALECVYVCVCVGVCTVFRFVFVSSDLSISDAAQLKLIYRFIVSCCSHSNVHIYREVFFFC